MSVLVALLVTMPILAASSATITVTESLGNSYDMVGATASMDNAYLASNGFIFSTGLDVDINSLSFMLASDRTIVATPLTANGTVLLPYTTGNTPTSAFDILTGHEGYITVADSAALELGNNFEIELEGYVDTSSDSNKNLVNKQDAFRTYVSASGEITSTVSNAPISRVVYNTTDDSNLTFYGVTWEGQTFLSDGFVIASVDLKVWKAGSPGDITVSIRATSGGDPTGSDLTSVIVSQSYITHTAQPGDWYTFDFPDYTLAAATTYAIIVRVPSGSAGNYIVWRADSSSPTYADGSRTSSGDSGSSWTANTAYDFMFDVYETPQVSVTATGVSSGEHTIKTTADATNLKIYIDTVEEDSIALSGASVPDNANNWLLVQNNVIPYMDFYKHTVGGVLITSYQPAAIIGGQTYSTGTVTGTTGTPDVIGTTTVWTSAMEGGLVLISGDSTYYTVSSVTDATNLVLTTNLGTSPSGATYNMHPKLIDETGSNNGMITFGSNPAGVAISVGALLPTVVVTPAENVADVPDLMPEFNPIVSSGVEGENFLFYGLFKGLMDDLNALGGPNISMAYFWKIVATVIALTVGTAVLIASRNLLLGIGTYTLLIAVPTAMGILDWYFVVWYVVGAVAVSLLVTKWTSSSI